MNSRWGVSDMTVNREVITGSDFKRMVTGAYSEFLLESENINAIGRAESSSSAPGTHILRTMGAAILPLEDCRDDGIGGLARRVANGAILGARGNSGVVLAQLFRGIAKGLLGKYNATSSEFGKAFQYGILYAQRVIPEEPERPIIRAAKAVAKGAYHAVRANLPISEILMAAIEAGKKSAVQTAVPDAGEKIMMVFLQGCLKGLDGNFVSPTLSFSTGFKTQTNLPDPRLDLVRPYCISLFVENPQLSLAEAEEQLQDYGDFIVVERRETAVFIHLHTDHPGNVLEQAVGWGSLRDIHINIMAEPHAMASVHTALMPVAVLAIAEDKAWGERLQQLGATVLLEGGGTACPSVGEVVNAAHSDIARSYVLLSNIPSQRLVMRQAKRIFGGRIELVQAESSEQQAQALTAFSADLSARENAERMRSALS